METLSMKRYELPPPPAGRLSEVPAWEEAIDNSKAQLEHQWIRTMNLELMLDYGIEAWKAYLEIFVALQAKAQNQLQSLKKEIQDVNWQRKQTQTQAGEKLRTLEANWVLLVSKNYEIEQQCVELEKKIQTLRALVKENQQVQETDDPASYVNGYTNFRDECENVRDDNEAATHDQHDNNEDRINEEDDEMRPMNT
ncbi:Pre-mRNA-splicing factor SPF27 [Eumeta japonica]|uniref:Pre-mRNA-splicing factor SPF27 n=1 Tax=Eumeta variegata TaxID=151549 RepID=A0A4C1T9A7_EUMVA|nr:Pre-mRNA-splicing factor SPF27 [Eumeta japonica]